ncbi:MAG TPA: GNAT family N-acetyltransferase [Candidatus Marinimicrobia bacterium]|nr:GNAT family N-acetyltransferase [Candidatus Neomarinimicrobiota bacterium]
MKIRQANLADNQSLLALSRSAPMESRLSVNVDRAPDYFLLANLQGDDARVFVAEQDGVIVGAIGCCLREVLLAGQPTRIGYIGGIKVAAAARKGLTSFRLMNAVANYLRAVPVEMAIVITMTDNEAMAPILAGRVGMPPFHPINRFVINYIFPLFRPQVTGGYQIRSFRESDLDHLTRLFTDFFRNYSLTFEWTPKRLSALLNQPNFSSENILIATKDGRPVAALTWWDQSSFKRTIVEKYDGWLKTLAGLSKPLKIFPQAGEPLNELQIRHIVYEKEHTSAARDLIRYLFNEKKRKYRLFRIGFQQNSPLAALLSGLPHLKIHLNCYIASDKKDDETRLLISGLRQGQIWEDLSLH